MTFALARDVEDFLQDQVRSGIRADVSKLVNDIICSLRKQRQKTFDLTPELEAWLLTAADKSLIPPTKTGFDTIRRFGLAKCLGAAIKRAIYCA
jgi:Arc/MetJ-type ribon-helix-helix transcriptional regulator